ncbi:MAG: LacI family DNA-binding transcriptional regulator [Clostridia bacterium]|nr:LacI family DNA-binding transcriptional regulator [Clostridia bacterium]
MSKPTMQNLADAVGVSRITVWKALSGRPGVSDEVRRSVQQKAAELGYGSPPPPPSSVPREQTFSVVVSRPESSVFWMQIIHHIAKELARSGISLMYTYMPTAWHEGYALPASLSPGSVDGFIVLNVYNERLLGMLSASPLPKVFLDTVPEMQPSRLGGDLVLLEGRTRTRAITGRLLAGERRRLGFIGDVGYAQTNLDRYEGFLDAHRALSLAPDPSLSLTGPLTIGSHYEQISRFLDRLPALPDGIVCASDFIAHFVSRYLSESGRAAPDSIILTGFDDNPEYANVAQRITTVHVDTSSLGRLLARKLMFRADCPEAPPEVSYIATELLFRGPLA